MAKVKVWNDNIYSHSERFKGSEITIPAGEYIEMDWEEAIEFKGQFTPVIVRGDGTHDPRGFKKIRVEQPAQAIFKDTGLVNHATGEVASSIAELKASLAQYQHMLVKDPDAERAASDGQTGEVAALRAELAEMREMLKAKGKPGRPPKYKAGAA